MTTVGELAFWAALLLSCWGTIAGILAVRARHPSSDRFAHSAARAVPASALLLAIAVAGLIAALLASDLRFAVVGATTDLNLPPAYRLAAVMSGPAGAWLVLATLIALLGAVVRFLDGAPAPDPSPALVALLNTTVLLLLVALAIAFPPFARAEFPMGEGAGALPGWQDPLAPLARLALLLFAATAALGAALAAARRPARRWWLVAWALGSLAFALLLRRTLTGASWTIAEWLALAAWIALSVGLHRRRERARLSAHLAHTGAVLALIALAGSTMRTTSRLSLVDGGSSEVRSPLGGRWRITSEGLSSYDELNRHVIAVLLDVRSRSGGARVARAEWRQYLDSQGEPLGDAVPAFSVLNGPITTVAVGFGAPPRFEGAEFEVRFIPLFVWWWPAAVCMIAAAAVALRKEPAA